MKPAAVIGVLAAALCSASVALASDNYPEKLQDELGLACAPQCTICHLSLSGGIGTATKRFALAMQITGELESEHEELIAPALEKIQGAECLYEYPEFGGVPEPGPCDSDKDGVPDVEELKQSRDPNVAGPGLLCGPEYGCGARIEPRGTTDWTAVACAAATALWLVLGRKRRSRSR
jgi:hypothetical protein